MAIPVFMVGEYRVSPLRLAFREAPVEMTHSWGMRATALLVSARKRKKTALPRERRSS
jgi:hypothetical protein